MYLQPMLLPTVALLRLSQKNRHWPGGDWSDWCGEIQFYTSDGTGPSQPRFTISASINPHKLTVTRGVLITITK